MSNELRLSCFDLYDPREAVDLAIAVESFGYHRFWVTEHRGAYQSASPIVLAGIVGSRTRQIRVGTAGFMVRYFAPQKVAEDLQLLEQLFPGRLDVGAIGGSDPSPERDAALLDGRDPKSLDRFYTVVDALREAGSGGIEAGIPALPAIPQFWTCTLSEENAAQAGAQGTGLAYHLTIALSRGLTDGPRIAGLYRSAFKPHDGQPEPSVAVVCMGVCGRTWAEAEQLWRAGGGGTRPIDRFAYGPNSAFDLEIAVGRCGPAFLGTPEDCARQLLEIGRCFSTNELVLGCIGRGLDARREQYRRIALALGISSST